MVAATSRPHSPGGRPLARGPPGSAPPTGTVDDPVARPPSRRWRRAGALVAQLPGHEGLTSPRRPTTVRLDDEEAKRVDRVFAALGDATRRDILRRAALGEHSVSALARHYSMSLAAVQKHVAVLERATLVTKRRRGREQLVRTDVATVQEARRQLESLESLWRGRLDRFGEALADRPEEQDP